MKYIGRRLVVLFVSAFFCVVSGCAQKAPDKSALDQQRKDIIGYPAPASAQAEIEAAKAKANRAQQEQAPLAQQQAQQQGGKPATQ